MRRVDRALDRWLSGVALGAAAAIIAYAAVRGVERAFFPEPNPALLIWSDRSPLLWRAAIALYLGGAGVFAGHGLGARSARAIGIAIPLAVLAAVAQAALAP